MGRRNGRAKSAQPCPQKIICYVIATLSRRSFGENGVLLHHQAISFDEDLKVASWLRTFLCGSMVHVIHQVAVAAARVGGHVLQNYIVAPMELFQKPVFCFVFQRG